ncbi:MAG: phosphatase, partial [Actinomycetota bacterium]|nr:phosphatase [Actinomycetota bacterium]
MLFSKAGSRALGACAAAALAAGVVFAATGSADSPPGVGLSDVPSANERAVGYAPASRLSAGLVQIAWAQGSSKLENPQGIVSFYGYENDTPAVDNPVLAQMVPTPANPTEAQKTEPDKNTYLTFKDGLVGPDATYPYGTHFLYQGHEGAAKDANNNKLGYITRINLDADAEHRVTLMATQDTSGKPLATIDGSTWDPFAKRLVFTTESLSAPTYAATADYPSQVEDVSGALGRGGYEGVQNDSDGNLWIVEDIGGPGKAGTTAKQPNSFVYRYVPRSPGDLHNGKLQALQVLNKAGEPITFESQGALNAPDRLADHSYGNQLDTQWVVVHDTTTDGSTPFNANAAAKAKQATPFKRPENGQFRPGSKFGEFYFDETGDTNSTSPENPYPGGGWGA